MTEFDYVVIAIVVLSAIFGYFRGFVREIFSLLTYVAAAFGTLRFGPYILPYAYDIFENYYASYVATYVLLFILLLILVGFINRFISSMISYTGLGGADSFVGLLFGVLRGLAIVILLVIVAGYTDLPEEPWWQNAKFSSKAEMAVLKLKDMLPEKYSNSLPYGENNFVN